MKNKFIAKTILAVLLGSLPTTALADSAITFRVTGSVRGDGRATYDIVNVDSGRKITTSIPGFGDNQNHNYLWGHTWCGLEGGSYGGLRGVLHAGPCTPEEIRGIAKTSHGPTLHLEKDIKKAAECISLEELHNSVAKAIYERTGGLAKQPEEFDNAKCLARAEPKPFNIPIDRVSAAAPACEAQPNDPQGEWSCVIFAWPQGRGYLETSVAVVGKGKSLCQAATETFKSCKSEFPPYSKSGTYTTTEKKAFLGIVPYYGDVEKPYTDHVRPCGEGYLNRGETYDGFKPITRIHCREFVPPQNPSATIPALAPVEIHNKIRGD